MRTAILGGTFDPIHLGHLLMADEVLARLDFDQVRFVPARLPPHKPGFPSASDDDRLAMVKLATAGRREFVVDDYELESEGLSYTVRTLRHMIAERVVEGRPGLVIGEDLVAGFDTWNEADAIEELAEIVLVRRRGTQIALLNRKHTPLDNLTLDISSTEIRERVAQGLPVQYLLHPDVYAYIKAHSLYSG